VCPLIFYFSTRPYSLYSLLCYYFYSSFTPFFLSSYCFVSLFLSLYFLLTFTECFDRFFFLCLNLLSFMYVLIFHSLFFRICFTFFVFISFVSPVFLCPCPALNGNEIKHYNSLIYSQTLDLTKFPTCSLELNMAVISGRTQSRPYSVFFSYFFIFSSLLCPILFIYTYLFPCFVIYYHYLFCIFRMSCTSLVTFYELLHFHISVPQLNCCSKQDHHIPWYFINSEYRAIQWRTLQDI
jgi:hypothetical protein